MKLPIDIQRSVFTDARQAGVELVPAGLIDAVQEAHKPLNAPSGSDLSNALFKALYEQFGYFGAPEGTLDFSSSKFRTKWVALIRWTYRTLGDWQKSDDLDLRILTVVLVIASYCDADRQFWKEAPASISANNELLEEFKKLICSLDTAFSARGSSLPQIWEEDVISRFSLADKSGDWFVVGELLHQLRYAMTSSSFVCQMVRGLNRFGPGLLIKAVIPFNQTFSAIAVIEALSPSEGLHLAIASRNPYVQFSCVFQLVPRFQKSEMPSEISDLLVRLLLQICGDQTRWARWMEVFNRHPLRYPNLQHALGVALASAPLSALEAYVQSISLSASFGGSRSEVAVCLRIFSEQSDVGRRHFLWRAAHERWSSWQFNIQDSDRYLFEIQGCELDYAVVSYAAECLNDLERKTIVNEILLALGTLDNDWHASTTDCTSAWHRVLSRLQPYAHAGEVIRVGRDRLFEAALYLPDYSSGWAYLAIMFNTTPPLLLRKNTYPDVPPT